MTRAFRDYRFETSTTMEELEMNSNSYGVVLKFGNKVILAVMNYKGETLAAVYESKSGHLDIESEIELTEIADQTFEDNGHAVAWAIAEIGGVGMSKDWTAEELQKASAVMKAAGHMSYEEFCEELERQDKEGHTMTQLSRDEFNRTLDDFLCAHPETEGMDIISVQCDSFWYAVGELDGEVYLLAENRDGVSMDRMEE